MQQRQLRLGDILDDYCPRERRLTNHAVVAMVGADVKQTRCTTCDTEHDYKHAKVPRQRRKAETTPALYSQVLAGGPKKRVAQEAPVIADLSDEGPAERDPIVEAPLAVAQSAKPEAVAEPSEDLDEVERSDDGEEGPVHRPLIRATLPRQEGQPPPPRQGPDFTIRQPAGRPHRFRSRQNTGQPFQGNRSGGGGASGPTRGGMPRQNSGRPPMTSRSLTRQGQPGRKRSK